MGRNNDVQFSKWLYKIGVVILLVLSVIALLAFIKALCITEHKLDERNVVSTADSARIETLRSEIQVLNRKVDFLLVITQKEPQKVYKYIKPKKDSCTIEVNIHNK